MYFGPGVHIVGDVIFKSDQTVIIDSGAVVYGSFSAVSTNNITFRNISVNGKKLHSAEEARIETAEHTHDVNFF